MSNQFTATATGGHGSAVDDNAPAYMVSLDGDLRITQVSTDLAASLGRDPITLLGQNFCSMTDPRNREVLRAEFGRLARGELGRFVSPVIVVAASGTTVRAELTATAATRQRATGDCFLIYLSTTTASRRRRPDHPERALLPATGASTAINLTDVTTRILEGVAAGASTAMLANRLYLSRQGVEYHVSSMLRRLEVPNRAALVSKAYSLGLLQPGVWPPKAYNGTDVASTRSGAPTV